MLYECLILISKLLLKIILKTQYTPKNTEYPPSKHTAQNPEEHDELFEILFTNFFLSEKYFY